MPSVHSVRQLLLRLVAKAAGQVSGQTVRDLQRGGTRVVVGSGWDQQEAWEPWSDVVSSRANSSGSSTRRPDSTRSSYGSSRFRAPVSNVDRSHYSGPRDFENKRPRR